MSEPTLVERMQQLLASYPGNMSLLLRPKGEAGGIITATEWVDLNDLRALLAENARLLAELAEARKDAERWNVLAQPRGEYNPDHYICSVDAANGWYWSGPIWDKKPGEGGMPSLTEYVDHLAKMYPRSHPVAQKATDAG